MALVIENINCPYSEVISLDGRLQLNVSIKEVIFKEPETIVKWSDGTKTVVKCHPKTKFDPEKGIAMAIAKKSMGNYSTYYSEIKKWTKNYNDKDAVFTKNDFENLRDNLNGVVNELADIFNRFR